MSDIRSHMTNIQRSCVRVRTLENGFRQFLSRSWDRVLHMTSRPEDVTAEVRRLGSRCFSLEGRETVPESYAEYWLVPPERVAEFETSFQTARSRPS